MKLNVSSRPLRVLVLAGFLATAAPLAAQTTISNTEAATLTFVLGPGIPEVTMGEGPTTAASTASSVLGDSTASAEGEATVLGEVKAKATSESMSDFVFGSANGSHHRRGRRVRGSGGLALEGCARRELREGLLAVGPLQGTELKQLLFA